MPIGDFFAGLVGGIADTSREMQKEKRAREDKEWGEQLDLFKVILANPDVDSNTKGRVFKAAIEHSTRGNKKASEQITSILGPQLGSAGSGGSQTAPQSPQGQLEQNTQPMQSRAQAQSPLPKFGPSPQRTSPFYSPEEKTQQEAGRAQALGDVQVGQNVEQHRQVSEINVAAEQKKLDQEMEMKKQYGDVPLGFTKPDEQGMRRMVYQNPLTKEVTYGEPVKPFDTMESMQTEAGLDAKSATARKEAEDTMLWASGVNPAKATPEQRAKAAQEAASLQVEDTTSTINLRKSQALADKLRAQYASEKGVGGLTDNQLLMHWNRQQLNYEKRANDIQKVEGEFNGVMQEAQEVLSQARAIEARLQQGGIGRDKDVLSDQEYQERAKLGVTWAERDRLYALANAKAQTAKQLAQSAKSRFGDDVVVTGETGSAGGTPDASFPTLRNNQSDFNPTWPQGLPEMPSQHRKGRGEKRQGISRATFIQNNQEATRGKTPAEVDALIRSGGYTPLP